MSCEALSDLNNPDNFAPEAENPRELDQNIGQYIDPETVDSNPRGNLSDIPIAPAEADASDTSEPAFCCSKFSRFGKGFWPKST